MRRMQSTPASRSALPFSDAAQRPRVCVIGAGNGGLAMAGHLAFKGLSVSLYSRSEEKLAPIRAAGGIYLRGAIDGFGPLKHASTDLAACVQGARIIMVTTPAYAHAEVARRLAPYLDGHIVVLNPGRTGGALEVHHCLQQAGARATVVEAQTFIYASRSQGAIARIYDIKRMVAVAAFPAVRTAAVIDLLRQVYPQFVPARSVLETSLGNVGAIFHPAPLVLNAPRVEHGMPFDYYHDGITPSVAKLMEQLDNERVAVACALGLKVPTAREWLYYAYGAVGSSLYEAIHNNGAYQGIRAPSALDHRYISEDVPTGLVPIAAFGEAIGVETPFTNSVIQMASGLHGRDYRREGRTLERLGLAGMQARDIQQYVMTGIRPSDRRTAQHPRPVAIKAVSGTASHPRAETVTSAAT